MSAEAPSGRTPAGRTGRRPGQPDTRAEIVEAARALFAERGYAGASVRAIAAAAGVDPALVHHYFGTKDGLFRAALAMPIDPEELVARIMAGGRDEAPRRIAETFLGVWDSPETGPPMVGFVRRVLADEPSADLARDFIGARLLRRVAEQVMDDDPDTGDGLDREARLALALSHLLGLVLIRHVLRLEPVASADPAALVAAVEPTITRYLRPDPAPDADPSPAARKKERP